MWTSANVIALVVAIGGAMVSLGVFLQKVNRLELDLAKLTARVEDLKEALSESRTKQGRRLGRIEGWITGSEALAEGKPAPLTSSRHDTRGVPLTPLPPEGSDDESTETEGGRRG